MPQSAGLYFALKVTMRTVVLHRAVFLLRSFYPNRAVARSRRSGGPGGRRPPGGARGVLAKFPSFSKAAAGGTRKVPERLQKAYNYYK